MVKLRKDEYIDYNGNVKRKHEEIYVVLFYKGKEIETKTYYSKKDLKESLKEFYDDYIWNRPNSGKYDVKVFDGVNEITERQDIVEISKEIMDD